MFESSMYLIIAMLLGLIPASIAANKGESRGVWWLYGVFLFPIAFIHSLLMKPDPASLERQQLSDGMRRCPFCAELVKPAAVVCKHCSRDIPSDVGGASLEAGRAAPEAAQQQLTAKLRQMYPTSADLNRFGARGLTPLMEAFVERDAASAKALIALGASTSQWGTHPETGRVSSMKEFAEHAGDEFKVLLS